MRHLTPQEAEARTGGVLVGTTVVELTPTERVLLDTFDGLLDQGHPIDVAVAKIQAALTADTFAEIDPAFWTWLR